MSSDTWAISNGGFLPTQQCDEHWSSDLQMKPNWNGKRIHQTAESRFRTTYTNKMRFNREKHKVLHLGRKNQRKDYKIGNSWLARRTWEKELSILVDNRLSMNQQCSVGVGWGKQMQY